MASLAKSASRSLSYFLAQYLGDYRESGWNGTNDYACYRWRGKDYYLPVFHYAATDENVASQAQELVNNER